MATQSWGRRVQGVIFRLPMMINCRQFEEFLSDYFEDGLTPQERRLFGTHLKFCRECREYLVAFETSMKAAKASLSSDRVPLPDDIPQDLVTAVLASRDADRREG